MSDLEQGNMASETPATPSGAATSSPTASPPPTPIISLSNVIFLLLPLLAVVGGVAAFAFNEAKRMVIDPNYDRALTMMLARSTRSTFDAKKFTDANGDMVADVPTDPSKQSDPAELVFAYIPSTNSEKDAETWKSFTEHLAKTTGKKVRYATELTGRDAQYEAFFNGKLHLTAFNTGAVVKAVNEAGFVPTAAIAVDGSISIVSEIIVPAKAAISRPEDIRGNTIMLTDMKSNSGFQAPLVILRDKFGMAAGRDYRFRFSGGHEVSIASIANQTNNMSGMGIRYEAAAVASDLLAREVAKGNIKPTDFRSIFKSEGFPPACFGYQHNLKPELAAKISESFKTYKFTGDLEKQFNTGKEIKFETVNFKDNWSFVRSVEERLYQLAGTGVIQSSK